MGLLVEHKHRVLRITLNRPEKRNALSSQMCSGIVNAVNEAQDRPDIGAILIGAAGQVFSAGMDLDEAAHSHDDQLADIHDDLFTLFSNSRKPIIVCVNGAALGGGLGLVAQGHIVLASQGAVFGLTEIRIGLWPLMVYRAVEAALGARRTMELSLTGRLFHAQEALDWGLVHQICPPGEVADRAKTQAKELAKASPLAVTAGMEYYHGSRGKTSEEAGELARTIRSKLMVSEDFKEGYDAFKHHREPHWPSMSADFYKQHSSQEG